VETHLKEKGISSKRVEEMNRFFKSISEIPPEILNNGMPWGGIEKLRQNISTFLASPGTPFLVPTNVTESILPWMELVREGTFITQNITPLNFEVSDDWHVFLSLFSLAHTHAHTYTHTHTGSKLSRKVQNNFVRHGSTHCFWVHTHLRLEMLSLQEIFSKDP